MQPGNEGAYQLDRPSGPTTGVDPLFPGLDAFEGRLRWIETLIWPRQWTLLSATGRAILDGPPDWLAFVLFRGWWVLAPFAVGACVGEAVRVTLARFSSSHAA